MKRALLMILAVLPVLSFAQGFQVNLLGNKQIGMGHTGTGLLQDGAQMVFNPGALAMLPKNSIQGGISPLIFQSTFNPTGTFDQYQTSEMAPPFSFYAVLGPKNSWWKFGLGVYTPYGGMVNWGNDWAGKYALTSLKLQSIFVQPTLSVKLNDHISLGGGFVYTYGSVDLQRAIPVAGADNEPGRAQLKGHGNGYGWNAGIFFKTESGVTLGISHRSKVTVKLDGGDAIFTVPQSLSANFPQPNTFSAQLPLAATTSVGIGIYPSEKWTLAADINFVQWSVYKELAFDYAQNTPTLADTRSPRNYQDAFAYRLGAEYKATDKLALRAGGGYGQSAVRAGYVTPEVPDANRVYGTLGLGYQFTEKFGFDVSFMYEALQKRNTTNIETNLSGTYATHVYIPGLSLSYRW